MKKNKKGDIQDELIKEFNLPKYIKGKSFADASIAIDNKFKDRKDQYSIQTKEELLERLAEAQEYVKMQEEAEMMANLPPEQQEQIMQQQMMQEQGGMPQEEMPQGGDNQMDPAMMEQMMAQQGGGGMPDLSQVLGQEMRRGGYTNGRKYDGGGYIEPSAGSAVWGSVTGNEYMSNLDGTTTGSAPGGGGIGAGALSAATSAVNLASSFGKKRKESVIPGDPTANMAVDTVKDTVATIGGPMFGAFRALQKGIQTGGNAIGGEVGAGIAGIASPEEATIANFMDKDMNFGEKLLGTIPGVGNILAQRSQKSKQDRENSKQSHIFNNQFDNDYSSMSAMGGFIGKRLATGGYTNPRDRITSYNEFSNDPFDLGYNDLRYPQSRFGEGAFNNLNVSLPNYTAPYTKNLEKNTPWGSRFNQGNIDTSLDAKTDAYENMLKSPGVLSPPPSSPPKRPNWLSRNLDSIYKGALDVGNFAPAIGSLFNKSTLAHTPRGSRMDNRASVEPVDERRMLNMLSQTNPQGMAAEMSGGDASRAMAGTMQGNLNKMLAQSDAYAKKSIADAQDRAAVRGHNLNVDNINVQLDRDYNERKARNLGAYNSAKIANRNAIFSNIGSVSREMRDKGIVRDITGYRWDGTYWKNNKGEKLSDAEYKLALAQSKEKDKSKTKEA